MAINFVGKNQPLTNSDNPKVSYFGTPVKDAVEFLAGNYKTAKGINSFDGLLVHDCILDIDRAKNIVSTQTLGEAGEYIEFIGNGNYTINFKLTLNNADGTYPEEQVNRLITILDAPAVIEVSCEHLNRFGIFAIVVMNHNLTNSGYVNEQSFTVSAKQHIDLTLKRI